MTHLGAKFSNGPGLLGSGMPARRSGVRGGRVMGCGGLLSSLPALEAWLGTSPKSERRWFRPSARKSSKRLGSKLSPLGAPKRHKLLGETVQPGIDCLEQSLKIWETEGSGPCVGWESEEFVR